MPGRKNKWKKFEVDVDDDVLEYEQVIRCKKRKGVITKTVRLSQSKPQKAPIVPHVEVPRQEPNYQSSQHEETNPPSNVEEWPPNENATGMYG